MVNREESVTERRSGVEVLQCGRLVPFGVRISGGGLGTQSSGVGMVMQRRRRAVCGAYLQWGRGIRTQSSGVRMVMQRRRRAVCGAYLR